jgi:uncharacterized membrane protein
MTARQRVASLDIIRGAVMVLMAIDHVRVYSGVPAGGPTLGIFFTRWITHFCAPAFVFFAGTAAFLRGSQGGAPTATGDTVSLARYLVTRGLMLVLLELTVIRASWTFNVDYSQFILAGVIWMLGWCMVLLGGLIWLPTWAIGAFGVLVILFQDVFGLAGSALPESLRQVWEFIYPVGAEVRLGHGGPAVTVLYVIVPWIGVMAAGYAFGTIVIREPGARDRLCLRIGLSATALFLVLGGLAVFLHPASAEAPPALIRLLNQRKYPASQLFLLMTLGPTIALLPLTERAHSSTGLGARASPGRRAAGRVAAMLATFGRVPMFYYLLHIPLIHATALAVWLIRDGSAHADWFATAPYVSIPAAQRWGLPLLYVVFFIDVAVMYPLCRWYARLKATHPQGWMQYI